MNKFFIIGIRRSGTSILRKVIESHYKINKILFEPHDLFQAILFQGFSRYKNIQFYKDIINNFFNNNIINGAKFALNPGIDALNWKEIDYKISQQIKYIFIYRNVYDTYKSYKKEDENSMRGIINYESYEPLWNEIVDSFKEYHKNHHETSCIINYDLFVKNPDLEIQKVWELLKIKPISIKNQIKIPNNWSK